MSESIVHFVPPSVRRRSQNLEAFIRLCRDQLTVFGEGLDWSSWAWPGARFTKLGTKPRGASNDDLLDHSFMDFAKGYFRYQQGMKPTGTKNELKALRAIEAALLSRRGAADIDLINNDVLNLADQMAREHYSPAAAYHAGRELARLAKFLAEKHLVHSFVGEWKSSIRRPKDVTIQTGVEARAIQEKKLPSEEALNALAEIFALDPAKPRDIFTTSMVAMSLCAPVRVSELLELPVDCEVEERDSKGLLRYGWRFFSGKGFEGDIKWIPTVMVPLAKEAISRIRQLTEPARQLARWLEEHPDEFYRHAGCPNVAEDVPLSAEEAASALGLQSLENVGLSKRSKTYTLRDLAHKVQSKQPKGFPWLSRRSMVKFSNGLFCMNKNLLHAQRGTIPIVLWAPVHNVLNKDLGDKETMGEKHQSIFDRYGYTATDDKRMRLTSHQSRHLLNTIANRGGMSQDLIAKWSGRADKKQNRVYNHMNEFERVAEAEAIDPNRSLFGPDGLVSSHSPITMKGLELVERGAVHATEYGVCVHDYVVSPCERFRDCLNCHEQVCIKGDKEKERRIRARLHEVEVDLAASSAAVEGEYSGADRWLEHHEKLARRLRQLVQIFDDPNVSDGALVKLNDGNDYSHLGRALREKLSSETLLAPERLLGRAPALVEK